MMQTWKQARFTFSVVALAILSPVSFAQVGDHGSSEKLGTVNFSTSCSSAAQPQFNRAVALMHSFQFANAIEAFRAILAGDPSCSMVYWGIALSDWGNPFASGLKSQAQLDAGLKAVEQGRRSPPKSERERAYLEAVARLYTDTATVDQRSRKVVYENAMAAVSAAYPEDMEAAIFYALAVSAAADPGDKTYARQLKAGEILDRLYVEYPNHPGLAHYIIHTYDVPPLATRAAGAAQHYSEIAPSTPHALHMPSHTFTRVGDWQASIDANVASAAAARSAGQPADEWHASDYLEYAYLQMAQDNASKSGGAAGPAAAYFARAAIPARYDLERRDWAHAAKLQPLPSPFPYTEAMTYFGRGLGAAHLKDTTGARAAIDSLARCRDRLNTMKEDFWANQVEIQRLEVVAWLAFSQGRSENALAGMRRAAELEDATEKSVITPGPLAPARELLGELLLESKRPAEALVEFESTLKREPNRFWSLYGAAESAKANVADRADQPGRRELVQARSSLSDQD
jgi:hypothetical protein